MTSGPIDSLRRVRRNLAANLAGHAAMALAQVVFVPIYLHILGLERFGLIGLYLTLSIFIQILDMGLSTTINRQMAVQAHELDRNAPLPSLLRVFEVIFAALTAAIAVAFLVAAPFVARTWLTTTLPAAEVVSSVRWMGVALALQLPSGFYMAALVGRERQALLNLVRVVMVISLGLGTVFVLSKISATASAFFTWYAAGLLVQVIWLRALVWSGLRGRARGAAQAPPVNRVMRSVLRFSGGVALVSSINIVYMQMDKLYVSARFPLVDFGAYSVAATVAGGLVFLVQPFFYAAFPRLSALHAVGDGSGLSAVYHQVCRSIANILVPIAMTLAIFPRAVLFAWTGNAGVARGAGHILSYLALGALALALGTLPYALQLAWERTTFAIALASACTAAFAASMVPLGSRFGATGVAAAWCAVGLSGAATAGWIGSRFFLREPTLRWLVFDTGVPLAVCSVTEFAIRWAWQPPSGRLAAAGEAMFAGAIGLIATFACRAEVRHWMRVRAFARH